MRKASLTEIVQYATGIILLLALLALLFLDHRKPAQVLLIGMIQPASPSASWEAEKKGVQQAILEWNMRGGMLGMMVKLRLIPDGDSLDNQAYIHQGEVMPAMILSPEQKTKALSLGRGKEAPVILIPSIYSSPMEPASITWNYGEITNSHEMQRVILSCLTSGQILYCCPSDTKIDKELLLKSASVDICKYDAMKPLASLPSGIKKPDWIVLEGSHNSVSQYLQVFKAKYPQVHYLVPFTLASTLTESQMVYYPFYSPGSQSSISRFLQDSHSGLMALESQLAYEAVHGFLETCQSQKSLKHKVLFNSLDKRLKEVIIREMATQESYQLYYFNNGLWYEQGFDEKDN